MTALAWLRLLRLTVLLAAAVGWGGPPTKQVVPPPVGSIDRSVLLEVIRSHRGEIRTCYEAQLGKFPRLSGRVAVEFQIEASGAVSRAVVKESTTANAALEACVAGRVAGWAFPRPDGGGEVVVTYPFVFTSAARSDPPSAPEDEGHRLLAQGISDGQRGAAAVASVRLLPGCSVKGCAERREVAGLCSAFAEAGRRLDAGAGYAAVAEPIHQATRALCCDRVLGTLEALGRANDEDKYTLWCDLDEGGGGVRAGCGWAACPAFRAFWPKLRGRPPGWFRAN